MIAIDAPEPDDNKPKKNVPKQEPPKMEPEERSFEALLKKLKPQLDKVPDEMRIPPLPPNEDASDAVTQYIRDKMGLTPATDVPNWVFIGNESLERSKIREGRIGATGKGSRVFAFLYPYDGKRFRTVLVYPKDGIDPRMIAKAILWGLVGEIPARHAQSEIRDVECFFALQCLDRSRLYDAPELERAKAAFREAVSQELSSVQANLSRTERELVGTRTAVAQAIEREGDSKVDAERQHNRAEFWKIVALAAIALLPLAAALARWLG
ncbi:MAG: hypothetical protein PHC88_04240 [Terrimicrobiaceae bacterium]|nr:hypothetical protein [Terrimicrobiaceae bacterium]